ncbi:serine/threonine-protein kinase [Candidatus Uabimicrobium amorphum]|uniref:Serine/threonine protein kinase n=1 Tax=Uabimicrobium amorphum TaxID=2596890 RepID=A0A5S9IK79_UABAM|nr:serine/threonine-protein kinase [Candidatus Uabimicrobium amorphum]BBM83383.1 serine/threonine protein kinase [Candidatus Uabimicrobium amorphum]
MADKNNDEHQHFEYRETERGQLRNDKNSQKKDSSHQEAQQGNADSGLKKFVRGVSQIMNLPTHRRQEKEVGQSTEPKGNYRKTVHYKTQGNTPPKEKINSKGAFIGRYQVLEEIGSGGFGKVYRGIDSTLHREVAIKTILSDKLTSSEVNLFEKEARVLARCNHPNIVQIYDVGKNDDGPYLVMEFINGPNLCEYIINQRARNDIQHVHRVVCSHMISIVDALIYMHKHNIFHQDIKPNNIIVSLENNSSKLVDFGLAAGGNIEKKKSTKITGTYAYMPPEKLKGKGSPKLHDIYALGIVFFEMLTGRLAHPGEEISEIVDNVFHRRVAFTEEDNVSKELQKICLKCLNKNPKRRYQDLSEFYDDLVQYSGATEVNDYPYLSVFTGEQKLIFPLVHKINFLGRTFSNHIVIPDQSISRSQALIEVADFVKIKNLSEVNKITIGSTQLKFDEEFFLSEPQTIQIANYTFHYIPRSQISQCGTWDGETITSASSQQQAMRSQVDESMWQKTVVAPGGSPIKAGTTAHFYVQQLKSTIEKLEKELKN